ncbi:MAG: pyrroline-5-carboxylate reductase [Clostridiales bacterium]|nr:pyrroline-5-carboxylate reductase [Candidatus Cacconaster stercorequi]
MTYGFIGTGNMGGALARAAAQAVEPKSILLANRTVDKSVVLSEAIGACVADNESVAKSCDCIFLGVKPQMMAGLLQSLQPILAARDSQPLLISMAAGLNIADIQRMAGHDYPTIRIMPNTPCAIGEGLTLYACSDNVTPAQKEAFLHAMSCSGIMEPLDEHLIDVGSAVAGCGGAYVCLFLESLADGAVACGLPRDKARRYAAQMLKGNAQLALQSGEHTGAMKDAICSPGGTTIAGVRALEEGGFRAAVMNAVIAAYERTKELK